MPEAQSSSELLELQMKRDFKDYVLDILTDPAKIDVAVWDRKSAWLVEGSGESAAKRFLGIRALTEIGAFGDDAAINPFICDSLGIQFDSRATMKGYGIDPDLLNKLSFRDLLILDAAVSSAQMMLFEKFLPSNNDSDNDENNKDKLNQVTVLKSIPKNVITQLFNDFKSNPDLDERITARNFLMKSQDSLALTEWFPQALEEKINPLFEMYDDINPSLSEKPVKGVGKVGNGDHPRNAEMIDKKKKMADSMTFLKKELRGKLLNISIKKEENSEAVIFIESHIKKHGQLKLDASKINNVEYETEILSIQALLKELQCFAQMSMYLNKNDKIMFNAFKNYFKDLSDMDVVLKGMIEEVKKQPIHEGVKKPPKNKEDETKGFKGMIDEVKKQPIHEEVKKPPKNNEDEAKEFLEKAKAYIRWKEWKVGKQVRERVIPNTKTKIPEHVYQQFQEILKAEKDQNYVEHLAKFIQIGKKQKGSLLNRIKSSSPSKTYSSLFQPELTDDKIIGILKKKFKEMGSDRKESEKTQPNSDRPSKNR